MSNPKKQKNVTIGRELNNKEGRRNKEKGTTKSDDESSERKVKSYSKQEEIKTKQRKGGDGEVKLWFRHIRREKRRAKNHSYH